MWLDLSYRTVGILLVCATKGQRVLKRWISRRYWSGEYVYSATRRPGGVLGMVVGNFEDDVCRG